MIRSILLLFACTPICVFSQTGLPEYKRLSLGINTEANYVESHLRKNRPGENSKDFSESNEIGKIGGTVGLNLDYRLTPQLSVGTGLHFSDRGYATPKTELSWATPDDSYPTHSKTLFTSYFVEFPLRVKYRFRTANCGIYVTGGPSVGHLIYRKTAVFSYYGNRHEKSVFSKPGNGYTPNLFSFHLGIGIEVPLSDRFSVLLEPLYRQTLTSLSHHKEVQRYFHSLGLNTHFLLRFKK